MGDELFSLYAKLTLDTNEFDRKTEDSKEKAGMFGDMLKADLVGKGIMAAIDGIKRLGSAMVDLTKTSVNAYSNYQQLSGGISKLFGTAGATLEEYAEQQGKSVDEVRDKYAQLLDAQDIVGQHAAEAFKTAGMSANDYMETVSGFSAALINSLGGDTVKAAERADTAMRAISDNVNTFGTDMGSVQNAFQGFAKQNYTMLDNLKLGYGGTKTEMERLIKDANEYGKTVGMAGDLSIDSFADIVSAIDLIQQKQNIAGTTSREAASTIEGSLNMVKGAWTNLVAGFANPDADIGELLGDVVESAEIAMDNLLPAVTEGIKGIGSAFSELTPVLLEKVPEVFMDVAPSLMESVSSMLTTVWTSVSQNAPMVMQAGLDFINQFSQGLVAGVPQVISQALPMLLKFSETLRSSAGTMVDTGIDLILNLAQGLMDSLPTLLAQLPQIVINIAGVINDNAPKLLVAGVKLLVTIGKGLIDAIPAFLENLPQIFEAFIAVWSAFNWLNLGKSVITAIKNGFNALRNNLPSTLKSIGQSAKDWFTGIDWANAGKEIIGFIESAIRGLFETIPGVLLEIGNAAWDAFKEIDWFDLGSKAIDGIVSGLKAGIGWIKEKAKEVAASAVQAAKDRLEVKSPSRVMRREVGLMYGRGLALGIEDSESEVERAIERLNTDMLFGINRDIDYSPRFDFVSSGSKATEGKVVNVTINSTVNGEQNAEEYAYALVQALQMELRTA